MQEEIKSAIKAADMVLVGLGEEFNQIGAYKEEDNYKQYKDILEKTGKLYLLPAYDNYKRDKKLQSDMLKGLNKLQELLTDKNYFVVSTAINPAVTQLAWKDGRVVAPCGGISGKQCADGCEEGLQNMSQGDEETLIAYFKKLDTVLGTVAIDEKKFPDPPMLGVCPKCGKSLILNNIYADNYDEKGYLSQWQTYTKWLQGTLNKSIVILELGVGMMFPSVIRWPFEKVAFFQNKAHLYRINEKLYQLSEDLKGKGTAIPKNSIDWLCSL